ncbi:IS30 family transposase [Vallitalea sediminicola]
MDSNKSIAKKYHHLSYEERIRIEILRKAGFSITAISTKIGRHKSTISREVRRNLVIQRNSDWTNRMDYFADFAQKQYLKRRLSSGAKIKLTKCIEAIEYVENKILNQKWSPDTAIGRYKIENVDKPCVTTKTIYNYIDLGLIRVKSIDLLLRVKLKKKKRTVRKNKRILGHSIDDRPSIINERSENGHWEIDTVIGKRHTSSVLMTLTERRSRVEIIKKIPDKTSNSVGKALSEIKDIYGDNFNQIFKSITCDNGSEFSFSEDFKKKIGVDLYYTHPYSSFERGTNENHNGIIRRFIPKGISIDEIPNAVIDRISQWMNTLPRKNLGYKTPFEAFADFVATA